MVSRMLGWVYVSIICRRELWSSCGTLEWLYSEKVRRASRTYLNSDDWNFYLITGGILAVWACRSFVLILLEFATIGCFLNNIANFVVKNKVVSKSGKSIKRTLCLRLPLVVTFYQEPIMSTNVFQTQDICGTFISNLYLGYLNLAPDIKAVSAQCF
jgi:hypothetical protein